MCTFHNFYLGWCMAGGLSTSAHFNLSLVGYVQYISLILNIWNTFFDHIGHDAFRIRHVAEHMRDLLKAKFSFYFYGNPHKNKKPITLLNKEKLSSTKNIFDSWHYWLFAFVSDNQGPIYSARETNTAKAMLSILLSVPIRLWLRDSC